MAIAGRDLKGLLRELRTQKADCSTRMDTEMAAERIKDCLNTNASARNHRGAPVEISGVFVCDDYLNKYGSESILKWFQASRESFVRLRGRVCLPLGGRVTISGLVPRDDIPAWLSSIMDHVHETILKPLNLPRPNHALVNAYEPGEGIMAHEDGPAYTPYATVLSVGSSCVFDFLSKTREKAAQIYLPVGSLLLFTDDAYKHYMHEVRSEKFDSLCPDVLNTENIDPARLGDSVIRSADNVLVRGFRVSITMRHVPIAL
jgi:alkylated DNA repair protein alkB family protein 6